MNADRSKGHVLFAHGFEYVQLDDGTLYRAPISNGLDPKGYRLGLRFESTPAAADYIIKRLRNETDSAA